MSGTLTDLAGTRIRTRSLPNVDTRRLVIRRNFLRGLVTTSEGSRTFESRMEWAHRAREFLLIQNQLQIRWTAKKG